MDLLATTAYFSMEIGLEPEIPTYSGGLGMLAGDTIRSAADFGVPMVGVTLVHRLGYFRQHLDATGWQTEEPMPWPVNERLAATDARTSVNIEGREVRLRAWRYDVKGVNGAVVPVYLLDSDVAENAPQDRTLTHYLYGGDDTYRLSQEVILGIGGVRMLQALGYHGIQHFHMNEGHASLLVLELLAQHGEQVGHEQVSDEDIQAIRPMCVFTTHTPVPAGHDQFPLDLVHRVLGPGPKFQVLEREFCPDGMLNLTYVGLAGSHYVNGVAKKHREVSQHLFARYRIDSITNGVHVATWASPSLRRVLDTHIPGWREDNASLRYALSIPRDEIWAAHQEAKAALVAHVNESTGAKFDVNTLTLGYARRATAYKRPELLFHDGERLRAIAEKAGALQIVYAGKAHPHDQPGKELIQRVFRLRDLLGPAIKLVYLENYDMALARLMTAGTDVWLNTPQPPLEASGTSGMKAAINGVPSLSILDGWWIEGCIEGVTGWAIGDNHRGVEPTENGDGDAHALYDKLERVILPLFYQDRRRFTEIMRHAIALNGSFFNAERMLDQYVTKAYFI